MGTRSARLVRWVQRQASHPWRWLGCLSVPLADYLVPVLPANSLLMSLAAGHPKRWRHFAVAFAVANAVGAVVIAWLLGVYGVAMLEALFGNLEERRSWVRAMGWIDSYGLVVLVPLSMLLFPPRVAVAATGIAGLNPLAIGVCVLIGRSFPMFAFAWLGSRSPRWARRFRPTRRLLEEMDRLNTMDEVGERELSGEDERVRIRGAE